MTSKVELFVARSMVVALLLSAEACKVSKEEPPAAATGTMQAAAPQTAAVSVRQQRIAVMRQRVGRDPADVKGWVGLGDAYFDSQQREKAVEAYGKALQIEPNSPDVLTDQGVMYRELGTFDKALANFQKASTIDPRHLPSLLDMGVLYAEDLHDPDKAIESWNRVIRIDPASPQAAKAHEYVEQMKRVAKPK